MTINLSANERIRVNVRSIANMAAVRTEKRNGRDVIIVPSATLPDNVVMNGLLYPAEEIEKSYKQLERKPAPLGHPMVNGQFVSASDPEGINLFGCGAWNENVRRENGRVFLDKVIDVKRANQSEEGKAVLAAIEAGGPVHTSTGLYCNIEESDGADGYTHTARNFDFDHDAILIGEDGAATPEQGVGMLVNSQGQHEQIKVINSSLMDDIERDLGWAAESAVRAIDRMERASMVESIVSAIKAVVSGGQASRETSSNTGDDTMTDKVQFEELSAKVNALSESAITKDDLAATLTEALKPLTDAHAEIKANQEAKDAAEHTALVNKLVDAKIEGLDKETIEKMDTVALNALVNMQQAKKPAAALSSGFAINTEQGEDDFSPLAVLNKGAN